MNDASLSVDDRDRGEVDDNNGVEERFDEKP